LRELRAQLHAGHDVVVITKPPAVGLGLAEVKQSLADAFAKAGLLVG
jgi:RNase P protein component